MKIGGSYRLREIQRRHWETCARDLRVPAQSLLARAEAMIGQILHAAPQVAQELHAKGIADPVIGHLVDGIDRHARECRKRLASPHMNAMK